MSTYPQGPGWWQASDGFWYPPQPYPPPAPAPRTSGTAVGALISAILSFVVCPVVPAIVALVLASSAQREIDESGGWVTGQGLASAAKVIAWVHLALVVVGIAIAFVVLAASTAHGGTASL